MKKQIKNELSYSQSSFIFYTSKSGKVKVEVFYKVYIRPALFSAGSRERFFNIVIYREIKGGPAFFIFKADLRAFFKK